MTTKPLDLPNLIRHAFLAGRGVKSPGRLSQEDLDSWMNYDPCDHRAYQRIEAALHAGKLVISRIEGGIDELQAEIDALPDNRHFDGRRSALQEGKQFLEVLLGLALGEEVKSP